MKGVESVRKWLDSSLIPYEARDGEVVIEASTLLGFPANGGKVVLRGEGHRLEAFYEVQGVRVRLGSFRNVGPVFDYVRERRRELSWFAVLGSSLFPYLRKWGFRFSPGKCDEEYYCFVSGSSRGVWPSVSRVDLALTFFMPAGAVMVRFKGGEDDVEKIAPLFKELQLMFKSVDDVRVEAKGGEVVVTIGVSITDPPSLAAFFERLPQVIATADKVLREWDGKPVLRDERLKAVVDGLVYGDDRAMSEVYDLLESGVLTVAGSHAMLDGKRVSELLVEEGVHPLVAQAVERAVVNAVYRDYTLSFYAGKPELSSPDDMVSLYSLTPSPDTVLGAWGRLPLWYKLEYVSRLKMDDVVRVLSDERVKQEMRGYLPLLANRWTVSELTRVVAEAMPELVSERGRVKLTRVGGKTYAIDAGRFLAEVYSVSDTPVFILYRKDEKVGVLVRARSVEEAVRKVAPVYDELVELGYEVLDDREVGGGLILFKAYPRHPFPYPSPEILPVLRRVREEGERRLHGAETVD